MIVGSQWKRSVGSKMQHGRSYSTRYHSTLLLPPTATLRHSVRLATQRLPHLDYRSLTSLFTHSLAASVEMFEIARPILRSFSYERTRRISRSDLDRYNLGMASWEEHWLPILLRQLPVDPLALSVMCPFAWFITLQYNAAAFVSWKQNRFYATDSEGSATHDSKPRKIRTDGPRGLTEWEMEGLEKCVRAAEGLIFTLSEESRIPAGWRAVQWEEAERADGWRKLVLDESVVNLSKWGMDGEFRLTLVRSEGRHD